MNRFLPYVLLAATAAPAISAAQELSIPFKTFKLDNGLTVVVHEDHSDPVVAVYLYYHVGSGREVVGRSGFAHLFEHMLFQGSQHVGDDQHFKLVQEAGGTLNGSTTTDRTNYFETLPANQAELALWLESDRMGFLLPAMTQAKLDNQRDVVKNERRQSYENRPYGQSEPAIVAALYPPDHPYSWTTIGSQEDLTAATLDDVKAFFTRWYGPNNATLAIGGDVKLADVKKMVERYFGSLPPGPAVEKPAPRPIELAASKRIVLEDRLVKLPQLELVWPTIQSDTPDDDALDMLAAILASNKWSVLDKALTIDEQLARSVSAQQDSQELAGTFRITLLPYPGVTLDTLEGKTRDLLAKVAAQGVDPAALQRAKNVYEARFTTRLETVAARTNMLCMSNCFQGDPAYYKKVIAAHMAVTTDDVVRVLKEYVLDHTNIALSTVPPGKKDLAASPLADAIAKRETPRKAPHVDAPTVAAEMPTYKASAAPADLDRTHKPAPGATITFRSPEVWHAKLDNGVDVVGTVWKELPLTTLTLSVPAGRRHEVREQAGLASLTAQMMNEGPAGFSTTQLSEELDRLGANLSIGSDDDEITMRLSCLDKNLPEAVKLFGEVLLKPRFAAVDFERAKKARLAAIERRSDSIPGVANSVFRRLLWGAGRVQGSPALGTKESVSALTIDDVRKYWHDNVQPTGARLIHVGARDAAGVKQLVSSITSAWRGTGDRPGTVAANARKEPAPPQVFKTALYLVDKPGAAQSEIRIGHLGVASNDPQYYPLQILNYVLGGSFSSRINLNLREEHGYTYGARSTFEGGIEPGAFVASAAVKTDVTKESVIEFMKELDGISNGLTPTELKFTQDALTQAAAGQYESTRALADYMDNISQYGWSDDYAAKRLKKLATFTVADTKKLADEYVHPEKSVILVVGDKARILASLKELPYGAPIELDVDGEPITDAPAATPDSKDGKAPGAPAGTKPGAGAGGKSR